MRERIKVLEKLNIWNVIEWMKTNITVLIKPETEMRNRNIRKGLGKNRRIRRKIWLR